MIMRRLAATVIVLATCSVAASRTSRPPTVELDGCVMPATACTEVRDVVKLRVGDRKVDFAVERARIPGSTASESKLLTELELRGLTLHGPKEVTDRLAPGAHVRVRGILRSGPMMLLQSIEPRPEK
jgi:hypothetical protein